VIYGLGMLELGMTFDYAQLLIDNEIARMVKKSVEGINVNAEELAVNVIGQVGAGGEFVSNEHTFRHFREQSQNKLIDRKMRDAWLAEGAKDLTERAYEEAKQILENHKPEPLIPGASETMRAIVEEAEKEYGVWQ
jgi:trimethylamine--corrinoid protein Co-methyltransferase